jgi:hypothetical protein
MKTIKDYIGKDFLYVVHPETVYTVQECIEDFVKITWDRGDVHYHLSQVTNFFGEGVWELIDSSDVEISYDGGDMERLDTGLTRRIDYKDWVLYKGIEYVREETLFLKHKLIDFHTITWKERFGNVDVEFYTDDKGWSKEGYQDKNNLTPEIELEFKRTIGKDLNYN